MQTRQGNAFETLRGAEHFLSEHARELPEVVGTGAHRRLTALIDELSTHVADQAANLLQARMATQTLAIRRWTLRQQHIGCIVAIARLELARTPEGAAFRMPPASLPVEKLAAVAHGIARAARGHATLFISAGLAADFADELDRAADDLVAAKLQRLHSRGVVRGATTGISRSLADGRRIVAVLDAFVRSAARGDAALLSGWSSVAHVPRLASADESRRLRYDPARAITAPAALRLPRESESGGEGDESRGEPIMVQSRVLSAEEGD